MELIHLNYVMGTPTLCVIETLKLCVIETPKLCVIETLKLCNGYQVLNNDFSYKRADWLLQ